MTAIDPYHYSRSIRGVPSEGNRTHRASDDCWSRGMRGRTVGTATDDGNATVKVIHADGTTEIRTAASFRKQNIHSKQRNHAHVVAQAPHRIMASDLAPIGNVE